MRKDLLSLTKKERERLSAPAPKKRVVMVQARVPGLDKVAPKKEPLAVPLWVNGLRNYWVWDASGESDPR